VSDIPPLCCGVVYSLVFYSIFQRLGAVGEAACMGGYKI
jgi:hypothetical protein